MSDFNPDKYLEEKTQPKFDPDAYLSEKLPQPKDESSASLAGLEHFANSVSMGYLPQLQAATQPIVSSVYDAVTKNDDSRSIKRRVVENLYSLIKNGDGNGYISRRDENSKRLAQESIDNPIASTVGKVTGALAGGVAMSPIMPGATASGYIPAIKAGAKAGAILGAVSNPGDVEGELSPVQPINRVLNAGAGGAIGGLIGAAGKALGDGGNYLKGKFSDIAENKAFESMGPYQRDVIKNADTKQEIGRTLLDKKVVSGLPSKLETLAERAQEKVSQSGENLESILNKLSKDKNLPKIWRDDIANKIKEQVASAKGVPGSDAKNAKVQELVDEFMKNNPEYLSMLEGNGLKINTGKEINFKRLPDADIPITEQVNRALYTNLKDAENSIASMAEKSNPLAKGFVAEKKDYGNLSKAAAIVSKRAQREFANRDFSLTDYIGGGIGAKIGGSVAGAPGAAVGAAAAGVTNKLARTYGNQAVAVASDAVSRAIARSQPLANAIQKNPALLPNLIERTINQPSSIDRKIEELKNNRTPTSKGSK